MVLIGNVKFSKGLKEMLKTQTTKQPPMDPKMRSSWPWILEWIQRGDWEEWALQDSWDVSCLCGMYPITVFSLYLSLLEMCPCHTKAG